MDWKMQNFKAVKFYLEITDTYFGRREARGYLIQRNVIYKVVIPFFCEGTKRSADSIRGSLEPTGREFYEITWNVGTKLDVLFDIS